MNLKDFNLGPGVNIARDPTTGTLFVYYAPTGSVELTFTLDLVLFIAANLPTVGTKLVENQYFTFEVIREPSNPQSKAVEVTLAEAVFDFGSTRSAVASAFVDIIAKVEALEGDTVTVGATSVIRSTLALRTPATFAESLLFNYSYLSQGTDTAMAYVDLLPGMRVRIQSQFSQLIPQAPSNLTNGYVTAGGAHFDVISTPDEHGKPVLGFDAFLASLSIPATTSDTPGGVGGLIDLKSPAFRRRHLRLCYPRTFPAGNTAGSRSLFEAVALLGADNLVDLIAATTAYYAGQTPGPSVSTAFFRGRTVLIPEVLTFANGAPGYVSVGTTCRNLLGRFALMPRLAGVSVVQFTNRYRRYLPLVANAGGTNANDWSRVTTVLDAGPPPVDVYDFPVLAGDSWQTGNAV
jgi:hypothetical protein